MRDKKLPAITECTETGYGPIPGANHTNPTYHYKLTPGTAYWINDAERKAEPIKITQADVERAGYTFNLRFVNGRTVAVFTLDGREVGQPLPLRTDGGKPPRKAKPPQGPPPPKPPAEAAPKAAETVKKRKKIGYNPL